MRAVFDVPLGVRATTRPVVVVKGAESCKVDVAVAIESRVLA